MSPTALNLPEHYDRIWLAACPLIRAGAVEIDPRLARGQADRRRGITLIAQPGRKVASAIADFMTVLQGAEPEQYFYSPSEFHVTVLSLFTATENFEAFAQKQTRYVAAVDRALRSMPCFTIEFRGITASAGAVLIQGFPSDGTLETIRARLRGELSAAGLGEELDQRYRLVTAHMTVVRFRTTLANAAGFATLLERFRTLPFGTVNVDELKLVKSDWYMSHPTQEWLGGFPLRGRI